MNIDTSRLRILRRFAWCAVLILPLADSSVAPAQTAEESGLAIAREAGRRSSGYADYTARLTMTLRTRDGRQRLREMRVSGLAVNGDGERTLIVFEEPRDLQGTALLTFSHPQESDDQWLYLPSFKRVKRIAAGNRSGSFMGSEFAYEDIGSVEVEKFTYRYVGDETLDGEETFVVERYPVDSSSGYSRQTVWVDRQEYRPLRIDYYDKNGELLKTLRFVGYRHIAGAYWRADEMTMINHQTGRKTTLTWSDYAFDMGLGARDFSPNGLARAR
jgi:outer membrane lipoprotein-sorting protein